MGGADVSDVPREPGSYLRRAAERDRLVVPEGETVPDREDQPCWCPDAFRDYSIPIIYCPRHGTEPDPELWDFTADPDCPVPT